MKKLILFTFCCCIVVAAMAQTAQQTLTVKGVAIDSATNKPLGYATVVLLDAVSQKSVKGGLTKDNGSFELKTVAGKPYQLTIATVGYANKVVKISGTAADVNVGRVLLSVSNNSLKEVAITGVRPISICLYTGTLVTIPLAGLQADVF